MKLMAVLFIYVYIINHLKICQPQTTISDWDTICDLSPCGTFVWAFKLSMFRFRQEILFVFSYARHFNVREIDIKVNIGPIPKVYE